MTRKDSAAGTSKAQRRRRAGPYVGYRQKSLTLMHAALRLCPSVLDLNVATPEGTRADAVEDDAEQHGA